MRSFLAIGLGLLTSLPAAARASEGEGAPRVPYAEVFSTGSGLRVALHAEPGGGTVAVCSSFPAGLARDGFFHGELARAVAETVREGGRRARSAEYSRLLESRGAQTRTFVGSDRVDFCTQAPAHELELALWLESGRSRPYAFTAENFAERLAELSLGRDQAPVEVLATKTRELAFPDAPRTGARSLSLETARQFHGEHYRPDVAVLAIAGDFEPASIKARVEQLFEEPAPSSAPPSPPGPPRQTSPRYMSLEDDDLVAVLHERTWVVPGAASNEHPALELAAELLAGNSDSLLGDALLAPNLARRLSHRLEPRAGAGLLSITIELVSQRSDLDLLGMVDQAVARLGAAPARAEQLEHARARLRVRREFARQAPLGSARWLSSRVASGLDPDPTAEERALARVRAEDVQRVARAYLTETRRVVVELLPREAREPFPNTVPRFHVVTEGDALARIARREGVSVADLRRLNELDKKGTLRPGQKLRLPPGKPRKVHVVKKGETLIGIGKRYGVTVDAIRRENKLGKSSVIRAGSSLTIPR